MEKTGCYRFMANYLMMVKVSAYRLKYIHLQIYNFHLEEATFLSKSQGLHLYNHLFHHELLPTLNKNPLLSRTNPHSL